MRRRPADVIPFRVAVRAWFAISLQTFGGPAGQIAVMQRTLVEEKRRLGQQRFLHALNYCMLLPGPEAQQLAIYTGWLLNGLRGGLVAGTLFVLPGVVALLALSSVYVGFGETGLVEAVFAGLAPAVIAIVVQALARIGRRTLTNTTSTAIAVGAFVALLVFAVPFPVVILAAAVAGWLLRGTASKTPAHVDEEEQSAAPLVSDSALHIERPSLRRAGVTLAIGLLLWFTPVAVAAALLGRGSVLVDQGLFFSGTALVTFGGAYAVLAYVAHQAVSVFGWVTPAEMVRGLALAESTPGPLIMVVQFVAFVGAYRDPGRLDPWVAAVLAALLTSWVTFVPCFLLILLGAPYVERVRHNAALTAALGGITAAVVGVIANLAVYFAVHTLFAAAVIVRFGPLEVSAPRVETLQLVPLTVTALALLLVFRLRWSVLRTLGVCAVAGAALHLATSGGGALISPW
jgi:chromate transporter